VFDPARPGSISNPDTSTAFASGAAGNLRDLKVDAAGSLYYLSGVGVIEKISSANIPRAWRRSPTRPSWRARS
jgi:hypothetical protein